MSHFDPREPLCQMKSCQLQYELNEAGTHKSAKAYAGAVFVPHDCIESAVKLLINQPTNLDL